MQLSDARHAFVTGGASGIGLGIADALAARGLSITIVDVDAAALAAVVADRAAKGHTVAATVLDVTDSAAVTAVADRLGPVDVLVNNAGIGPDGAALADLTAESFDRVIGINLAGVFNGIHAFAADMRARGRGHIVSTSSVAGLFSSAPGVNAYAMAKFGVTAMSETLRVEMAPHGVGVSVLCPGFVATNIIANTARISETQSDYDGGDLAVNAMDPRAVGELVADAIEANELYVLTHKDVWPAIAGRHAGIAAAFGETA